MTVAALAARRFEARAAVTTGRVQLGAVFSVVGTPPGLVPRSTR